MRIVTIMMVFIFLFVGCSNKQEDNRAQIKNTCNVSNDEEAFEDTSDKYTADSIQTLEGVGIHPKQEVLNPTELAQKLSLGNIDAWKLIHRYYMNDDTSYIEPLRITASMDSVPDYIRYEAAKILHDHDSSFSDSILKNLPEKVNLHSPHLSSEKSLRRHPFFKAGINKYKGIVHIYLGLANGIDQLYYRSPFFDSEFSEILYNTDSPADYIIPDDMLPLALNYVQLKSLDGFYLLGDTLPATELSISSVTYQQDVHTVFTSRLVAKTRQMHVFNNKFKDFPKSFACYSPDSPPTYIVRNNSTIKLPHPVQLHVDSLKTLSIASFKQRTGSSIPVDSVLQKFPDFFWWSAHRFFVVDSQGNNDTRYLLISASGVKDIYGESCIVDEDGRRFELDISNNIVSCSNIIHDTSGKESDYLIIGEDYGSYNGGILILQSDGEDNYRSIHSGQTRYD